MRSIISMKGAMSFPTETLVPKGLHYTFPVVIKYLIESLCVGPNIFKP